MRICANKVAQFFVQDEYCEAEIQQEWLVISSAKSEERIPFSIWDGTVCIQRGITWGTLTFYSHADGDKRLAWVVQGLPWSKCRLFAKEAAHSYQVWHQKQCSNLNEKIPEWKSALDLLIKQPSYLTHSEVDLWQTQVQDDLTAIGSTLAEAEQKLPSALTEISDWLEHCDQNLEVRNSQWLERERQNWEILFAQVESSPLNLSQQQAVLMNNDHNLILAGAGSGKTSVLTARVAYLLQSHLAQAEEVLMLAFGRDAAEEMSDRLNTKVGLAAENVTINTFHQLGLKILNSVEEQPVVISPMATDDKKKKVWCSEWLKQHWQKPANFKRWQKHLSQWPVAYLKGDDELIGQSENPKLLSWLESQMQQLCMVRLSKKQLQEKLVEHADYSRLNSELSLVWPCYQAWQQMLKETQHIDFNVMITKATHYVLKGKFKSPWRYIMVDEYQDISPDRLALIDALCDKKVSRSGEKITGASLYAVGDDWQSIYQFAGSDVDLITNFSNRYSSSTIHKLDTTYRFNNQIGMVASQFIMQNPVQIQKELMSFHQQKKKAVVVMPMKNIESELSVLNNGASEIKEVLLLGRNHYHKPECLDDWKKRFQNLDIQFMTCHASKGKEADFVFILNVDEGQFPSVKRQQHLDSVLAQSKNDYPFAEERRLFYVALTRAKQKVWIAFETHPSEFVKELTTGNYAIVKKR